MVKVLINGCNGKMGQVVANQIKESKGFELVAGVDRNPNLYNNDFPVYRNIFEYTDRVDVIIDFSHPCYILNLLDYAIGNKVGVVIATTGFSENDMNNIREASEKTPIFYSANMSLGINILIDLVKKVSLMLQDSFDIEIVEKHHNEKIDAPSGTAYMIADEINRELNNSKEFVFNRHIKNGKRLKREIGIHAIRGGTIVGEHSVIFAGLDEVLEINHIALSKKIFAVGALKAASFLKTKEKGLYTMDDLVNFIKKSQQLIDNKEISSNDSIELIDPYEIAKFIKNTKRSTPVKVYIKGELEGIDFSNVMDFGNDNFKILIGEHEDISCILDKYENRIEHYYMEQDRKNSAIPLLRLENIQARIEPGAIVRDKVRIGKNAVIMMGAVINIGAEIGEKSMIDMNAVVGARGIIGNNVHVGAGAVIAGVLEPPSKTPVVVEDGAVIGANAVILEGVKVGKNAVVAAGSVVTKDVPTGKVVAGIPARIIKEKDDKTMEKVRILDELRG